MSSAIVALFGASLFEAARSDMESRAVDREQVVPIANLFYEDGGAGVVETSQHPPTTATERFRLELVSLGEHLRQVLHTARQAGDVATSPRTEREVRRSLQALEAAAEYDRKPRALRAKLLNDARDAFGTRADDRDVRGLRQL